MDAPQITDLPTSAQRVLADHLGPSNAARCRLASNQLSNVAADRAGSRLWVVANSFRSQIDHDADMSLDDKRSFSKAWRDAGGPSEADVQGFTETLVNAVDEGLLTATSLSSAAEGVVCAEVWVDASRPCEGDTWQALFRSLLSSSTLQELTITEYCSHNAEGLSAALKNREISSCSPFSWSKAQQQSSTQSAEWDPHRRFNRHTLAASDGGWLPAMVHAALRRQKGPLLQPKQQQGQQQQQQQQQQQGEQQQGSPPHLRLSLQLLAPLLPEHSILLLQLQGVAGLSVSKTSAWLDCQSPEAQQGQAARYTVPVAPPTPWWRNHDIGDAGAAAGAAGGAAGGAAAGAGFFPPEYRPAAPSLDAPVPVLPTSTLRALRRLPQLDSLSGTVGRPMMHNEKPGEVGTMLQQLLLDLGPQLTQLTLGTLQNGPTVHYSLSAPLKGMSALRSLTCNLGFSLDVDTDLDDAAMLSIQEAAAGSGTAAAGAASAGGTAAAAGAVPAGNFSSSSSSSSRGPRPPPAMLFPSLTRLVLVDPACVPDVLEQLAFSEAAFCQLQHLEIPALAYDDEASGPDYNAYLDQQQQQRRQDPGVDNLQQLGKLQGLRELKLVTCGPWQMEALVAAVGSQLLGLTVTTQKGNPQYLPAERVSSGQRWWDTDGACMTGLNPLVTGMTHLTSLKIIGGTDAVLYPQKHLPAAAQHLTALKQLSYTGRINSVSIRGAPGVEILPGMLPTALQGLTLVARQSDYMGSDHDGRYNLHPDALPKGLTSLKCRGFFWERPHNIDPWSLWVGWELLPAGLRRLELDVEGALPNAGGCGIWPVSSANSSGAAAVAAAAADVALDPSWEPLPEEVVLPSLDSVALHVHANRHADPGGFSNPPALCLSHMCDHMSGLTALTHLHISSRLRHDVEEPLAGLEPLMSLKLLTLHVGLPGSAQRPDMRAVHDLVEKVEDALARCMGLRVLRLPRLSFQQPYTLMDVEAQHPNCLIMESQEACIDEQLLH